VPLLLVDADHPNRSGTLCLTLGIICAASCFFDNILKSAHPGLLFFDPEAILACCLLPPFNIARTNMAGQRFSFIEAYFYLYLTN
jgi:hypothetical protein